MSTQTNTIGRRIFIAFLIAMSILLISYPMPAHAVTAVEKEAEAQAMMSKLDDIQDDINAATDAYNTAMAAHDSAIAAMAEAQRQIDEATATIAEVQPKLATRAANMYKRGETSFVDVLLGASSFEEFVSLWDVLNSLNQQDANLVEQTKVARTQAQAAHTEYSKQEAIAAEQLASSKAAKDELDAAAANMQAQVDALTAEAAELLAEEERAAAASDAGMVGANVVSGSGTFTHPCPGYSRISSTFGWRSFDNSFHQGVDFAASSGTPIYAADSGTVVIAGLSSSAGNWVVISHGNGITTKYMHMVSTPFVSAGEAVGRGQNIGQVGSTGYSTGPHLHFQVEVNGSAEDPMGYL